MVTPSSTPTAPTVAQVQPVEPAIAAVSPPSLLEPVNGAVGRGVIVFRWQPTGPLPNGAGYEVVWWNPDEPPAAARGLAPPTQENSLQLNIDVLFVSNQMPGGRLFWSVLVVTQQPYRRLTRPENSPQHGFVYQFEGPSAPVVPPPPR